MLRDPRGISWFAALPLPVTATSLTVAIDDPDNPDGFVQAGMVFAGKGERPAINLADGFQVGFVEEAQKTINTAVPMPAGYRLVWGGQFENQRRAANRLAIVIPIALTMIFGVLFATLRSLRQSVLILANVPFALVGGILALWISGEYLSVPASVGFIALLGIAVLNGLVLVSYFNQLLAEGNNLSTVVFEGSLRRLRPVLMTASIAAFGLVPLLYASGPGSEIQKPLAIVVIGGLFSSTVLTLFLLPILFRRFGVSSNQLQHEDRKFAWINALSS